MPFYFSLQYFCVVYCSLTFSIYKIVVNFPLPLRINFKKFKFENTPYPYNIIFIMAPLKDVTVTHEISFLQILSHLLAVTLDSSYSQCQLQSMPVTIDARYSRCQLHSLLVAFHAIHSVHLYLPHFIFSLVTDCHPSCPPWQLSGGAKPHVLQGPVETKTSLGICTLESVSVHYVQQTSNSQIKLSPRPII